MLEVDRQLNINDHIPPCRACLSQMCLSARTGPRASPSIPSMCHKNMRECLLNSAGITRGQRSGADMHRPPPSIPSLTQHLGRSVLPRKSTWLEHMRGRWVLPHIPSCFLLLKLHCLLQCKKYPESGEEYLIYNISASCFVWFSCLWQETDDNSVLICPSSILFLPSNLIFILTTSSSMRFW